jgi:uncharacterized protein
MAVSDATIEVIVDDNKMKVTANYFPPKNIGNPLSEEDVIAKLSSMKINTGIKQDNIKSICASDEIMRNIILAEGIPPEVGKKARFEYCFELNSINKANVREDGSVDFRDLGEISSATEGEELFRRIPPAVGEPGKDVFGGEIPGILGNDLNIVLGKGTEIDEKDTNLVRSTQNGEIIVRNGTVEVIDVHNIKGDVDYSTGNVKFNGSIKILGNVKAGFKVSAEGDIIITGNVEDAEVTGENDITIMGGFTGNGDGVVQAARDVFVKFVENQNIEAARDIIISGQAYHSHLRAGRSIEATGPKSMIVGGLCEAKTSVISSKIGSDAAVATKIIIGVDPKFAEVRKAIEKEIKQINESKEKISKSIQFLKRQKIDSGGKLPPDKTLLLQKLEKIKVTVVDQIEKLQKKVEDLIKEQKEMKEGFAIAKKAVYPKIQVVIGRQSLFNNDTLGPSKFELFKGEVVRFSK